MIVETQITLEKVGSGTIVHRQGMTYIIKDDEEIIIYAQRNGKSVDVLWKFHDKEMKKDQSPLMRQIESYFKQANLVSFFPL